jgi:hypothetical protein
MLKPQPQVQKCIVRPYRYEALDDEKTAGEQKGFFNYALNPGKSEHVC